MMKKYIAPIAERVEMQLDENVMLTVSMGQSNNPQLSNEAEDQEWDF